MATCTHWPGEHKERLERLAMLLVKIKSVQLIRRRRCRVITIYYEQISEDAVICIFHTRRQSNTRTSKTQTEKQIQEIGEKRCIPPI